MVRELVCRLILRFGYAAYVAETVHVAVCVQVYLLLLGACVGVRTSCIAGLRFNLLVNWGFAEVGVSTESILRCYVRRVGECIWIGVSIETGVVADGGGVVGSRLYLLAGG